MNYRTIIFAGLVLFTLLLPLAASAATADLLVLEGRALLEQQTLVQANAKFKQALDADASHQEANFFYAITRLLSPVEANQNGPNSGKMDSIKELLDKFGISQTGRTIYNWTADFTKNANGDAILPSTTPKSADIQEFVLTYVLPEIDESLANLSKIEIDFNTYITPAMLGQTDSGFVLVGNTEIDYGDIALLKAVFQGIKTSIYIDTAYNSDIDIYDLYIKANAETIKNINQLFAQYPQLLKIKRSSNFAPAKASFTSAIDLYLEASDFIRNESDDQLDDLVSIDPFDLAGEADLRDTLNDIKLALNGPKDIRHGWDKFRDPSGDFIRVDLTRLFDSPADLRDYIGFAANTPCVPDDPTINGLFPYFSKSDWGKIVDAPEMLTVYSGHHSDGYNAGIFFEDNNKSASSVTAKGPGIIGTTSLAYRKSSYLGDGWYDNGNISLGTSIPSTPQWYNITVKDAYNTCTFEKRITGYVKHLETDLSPSGKIGGDDIGFSWSGVTYPDDYSIVLYDSSNNRIWLDERPWYWTGTPYYGPSLTPGKTYHYQVISWVEQDNVMNYSAATEQFTYVGIPPLPSGAKKGTVYSYTWDWNNRFDFSSGNSTWDGNGDFDYNYWWYQDIQLWGNATSGSISELEEGNGIDDFKKWVITPNYLPPAHAWSSEYNTYNTAGKNTLWIKTREGKYAMIFPVNVTDYMMEFYYVYPYGPNGGYKWSDWSMPEAPDSFTVTDLKKGGQLLVEWQPPVYDSDIAGYKIIYGTDEYRLDKVKNAGKTESYTLSGLNNKQTYYVQVLSYNAEGNVSDNAYYYDYQTATPTDGKIRDISIAPSAVTFEDVSVNNISGEKSVTISNTGTAMLHVQDINIPNTGAFVINIYGGTNPCGTSSPVIPPNGKCTVSVKFGPHSTGDKAASLAIISDDPDYYENPAYVALSGKGISGEGNCFDGIDNDSDTLTDCKDPDCAGTEGNSCNTGKKGICSEGTLTCSSGKQQCIQINQPQVEGPLGDATCSDAVDNDCDGSTDSTDLSCSSFILNVTTSGAGNGTVTGTGINCVGDCTETYPKATNVTLTAKPDAHSEFGGWSGDCTGIKTTVKINVNEEKTCTAAFNKKTYELKTTLAGTGAGKVTSDPEDIDCGNGSMDCKEKYEYGTQVTLTAQPLPDGEHSLFEKWTGDCNSCKGNAECQVTVDKAKNCTAQFKAFELKVTPGLCTGIITSDISGIDCGTDCKDKYAPNTMVKLSYTADPVHSLFTSWKGCDKNTPSNEATCQVTMKAAANVSAVCAANKLTVTKAGTGAKGGAVMSEPSGIDCGTDCKEGYAPGTPVILTATSSSSAAFTGWSVKSCGTNNTCVVTMEKAKTVTASFASYELKVVKSGKGAKGGTVTSEPSGIDCGTDCSEKYPPDTSVTLTAATDSATAFTGWSEKSCINTTCEVTLDKAKTVTARFSNTSSITGYVKDITGKGIAGITVTAYLDEVKVKAATTDAKGKYVLEVPVSAEEVEYMLSVGKAGYGFSPSEQFISVSNISATAEEDFIGFIYVVKGTVVMDYWNDFLEESELKPVSGATVKLKKVTGENEEGDLTYKVIAAVITGKNGTFSFSKNVTPYDEYEISASYKKLTGYASIDVSEFESTTDGIIDAGEIMIEDFTEEEF